MIEMEIKPYLVYALVDAAGRIINLLSVIDGAPIGEGWQQIDEGHGDRFKWPDLSYFEKPLMDARGVYRYAYDANVAPSWRERTTEEMDKDAADIRPVIDDRDVALAELAQMTADNMLALAELAAMIGGEA